MNYDQWRTDQRKAGNWPTTKQQCFEGGRQQANVDMRSIIQELATELADEINGRYQGMLGYPHMAKKYKADMDTVRRAQELLGEMENNQ